MIKVEVRLTRSRVYCLSIKLKVLAFVFVKEKKLPKVCYT